MKERSNKESAMDPKIVCRDAFTVMGVIGHPPGIADEPSSMEIWFSVQEKEETREG
jgi:hypothetical protein